MIAAKRRKIIGAIVQQPCRRGLPRPENEDQIKDGSQALMERRAAQNTWRSARYYPIDLRPYLGDHHRACPTAARVRARQLPEPVERLHPCPQHKRTEMKVPGCGFRLRSP